MTNKDKITKAPFWPAETWKNVENFYKEVQKNSRMLEVIKYLRKKYSKKLFPQISYFSLMLRANKNFYPDVDFVSVSARSDEEFQRAPFGAIKENYRVAFFKKGVHREEPFESKYVSEDIVKKILEVFIKKILKN